jgi:hypothetical protein
VTSRASAQPTPSARVPHIIHQSMRFRPRMCLLGGLIDISHPLSLGGVIPEKPLILEPSMGIPSLNVYGRISAQEKRITTLNSSKCASRQDTQCAVVKAKEWAKHSRKCRITFRRYTQDEKHQQSTHKKPIPRNRLVTSKIVCDTI